MTADELGAARVSLLPPLARPLALPLPAARTGLRGGESPPGRPRRPAPRLHVPEPRAGARLALAAQADVVGVYCMATMRDDALWFARQLRGRCELLVAGGPLPTCEPETFLADFDVVVRGEGEQTMVDVLAAHAAGADPGGVPGAVAAAAGGGAAAPSPPRPLAGDLDALPFPARDLLPNAAYISHGRRRYGYAVTTVMASRGCPFACEFCSNVVFGDSYRERSPAGVVDEIEQALALGYDRIAFADDVFTLRGERVVGAVRRDRAARPALRLGVPRARRRHRRRDRGAHAPRRLPDRLLRHRVRLGRGPAPHAQGHHGGAGARGGVGRPRRGPRGGRVLHPLLPRRDRRHGARDPALRRLPAARLPRALDAVSAAGDAAAHAARGPRHGRGAARRQPPAEPAAHVRRRLLGAEDALRPSSPGRGQFVLRRRLGRFGPAAVRLTRAPAEALFRRLR